MAAGLAAIPPAALAVLVVAAAAPVQVLAALELLDKAILVVMAVLIMGALAAAAQAKPDLTGRNLSQLAAGTALRHQSQEHQLHALAVVVAVTYLGEPFRVVRVVAALAVRTLQVLSRGRQILAVAVAVAVAREQGRRVVLVWSLFPCQLLGTPAQQQVRRQLRLQAPTQF